MKGWLLTLALLLLAGTPPAQSQRSGGASAADLAVELRKLNTLGSVLYVAAHPDDENTAFLTYLAKGRGVRAAYLSITARRRRPEPHRRREGPFSWDPPHAGAPRRAPDRRRRAVLHARRRLRLLEESRGDVPHLGKDKILGDVVWVIRKFRPDVIVTRFPTTGEGGHGHHTASAILAEEAFAAAADPKRFPEQLGFTQPWQPKRLLFNTFRLFGASRASEAKGAIEIDLGGYDPILGKSYTEIAGESRSQHKSQGFGAPERRGSRIDAFQLVKGDPVKDDLLDGVDLTWGRLRGGERWDRSSPRRSAPSTCALPRRASHCW